MQKLGFPKVQADCYLIDPQQVLRQPPVSMFCMCSMDHASTPNLILICSPVNPLAPLATHLGIKFAFQSY
jgi:hypothetical protein